MPCPMVPAPRIASCLISVLTATEVRLPFLEIREQPFSRIVALEETLLQLALEGEAFGKAGLEARLHGTLDVADGFRGLVRRRELPRVFLDRLRETAAVQLRVAPHVIDQAEVPRVLERRQRAHRQQLDRLRLSDEAGKALCSASPGQHTERHF